MRVLKRRRLTGLAAGLARGFLLLPEFSALDVFRLAADLGIGSGASSGVEVDGPAVVVPDGACKGSTKC